MVKTYYKILEIAPSATIKEIKLAFRQKAKSLHPDVNDSPSAHDDFIKLNEAYEYIIGVRTGKIASKPPPRNRARRYARRRGRSWTEQQREAARARAREYARMQYEEFKKSDRYKMIEALNTFADYLQIILALFVIIGIPIIGTYAEGANGLVVGGFMVLITAGFWAPTLFHFVKKLLDK